MQHVVAPGSETLNRYLARRKGDISIRPSERKIREKYILGFIISGVDISADDWQRWPVRSVRGRGARDGGGGGSEASATPWERYFAALANYKYLDE
jgi:hypothetical protein